MATTHQPDQAAFRSSFRRTSIGSRSRPSRRGPPRRRGPSLRARPYVVRVKVPSGVKLMPHRHHEDRVYTVMSGVFYIGLGDQFDEAKLQPYPPGAVVVLPGARRTSTGRNPVSTSHR